MSLIQNKLVKRKLKKTQQEFNTYLQLVQEYYREKFNYINKLCLISIQIIFIFLCKNNIQKNYKKLNY